MNPIDKQLRILAWQILVATDITNLPVNINHICKDSGIRMIKYSSLIYPLFDNYKLTESVATIASSFSMNIHNKPFIFYDDAQKNIKITRFAIAHELGHILLKHNELGIISAFDLDNPTFSRGEKSADAFATYLLAPSCILRQLEIHTPDDIVNICNIPYQYVFEKSKYMKQLCKHNIFLDYDLEYKVCMQFSEFIQKYKKTLDKN